MRWKKLQSAACEFCCFSVINDDDDIHGWAYLCCVKRRHRRCCYRIQRLAAEMTPRTKMRRIIKIRRQRRKRATTALRWTSSRRWRHEHCDLVEAADTFQLRSDSCFCCCWARSGPAATHRVTLVSRPPSFASGRHRPVSAVFTRATFCRRAVSVCPSVCLNG